MSRPWRIEGSRTKSQTYDSVIGAAAAAGREATKHGEMVTIYSPNGETIKVERDGTLWTRTEDAMRIVREADAART